MRKIRTPERGEAWWVRLDPTLGSEIDKTRPCLIMTTNVLNERRRTVVVIPLLLRAVSKDRLDKPISKISVSKLTTEELAAVEEALRNVLEL